MKTPAAKVHRMPLMTILAGCGLIAVVLWLFVFPCSVSAVSPDGRFTAKATYSNLWGRLAAPADPNNSNLVRITLTDHTSGRCTQVDQATGPSLIGDGEAPVEILWKSDSKSFVYIYTDECNGGDGKPYDIAGSPASAHRTPVAPWIKPLLQDRISSGGVDGSERALLNKLSSGKQF